MSKQLIIGTRGSALARVQTELIRQALLQIHSNLVVEVREIKTLGDKHPEMPAHRAQNPGIFVKEIEDHLLRGDIDLAVHSLKDLPTQVTSGTTIAAVPQREDPRDVLISGSGQDLDRLPPETVVGTGSPRRKAQLLAYRPDLNIRTIRGNVETRLRKLHEGEYEAIILAAAGLHRLGRREAITQYLSTEIILPEVGQGALALQVRKDDRNAWDLARPLNDSASEAAVTAERAFLAEMGGGCAVPITAFARVESNRLILEALVAAPDGSRVVRRKVTGRPEDPEEPARLAAAVLREMGAMELLSEEEPTGSGKKN